MRFWGRMQLSTFQIIALGFAGLILVGTLLLMLPAATYTAGGAAESIRSLRHRTECR